MIAHKFQSKGCGKMALQLVIEQMMENANYNDIYLSFDPRNEIVNKLYESLGFCDTGRTIDGELLYCLLQSKAISFRLQGAYQNLGITKVGEHIKVICLPTFYISLT